MRVVRTLLGILLLTVAVLASVAGGALWVASGHEGPGGTFGAPATGLSSTGHAIVVPDVDAFLGRAAPFARAARTSVTVDGMTTAGPAFIGLAPLAAVRLYLGPAAYGTVTAMHLGLGGPVPVEVSTPPGPNLAVVPGGAPGTQRFWVASGLGSLTWAPADRTGLALVIMRGDAGAGLDVTGHVAVRPGWLGRTALAFLAVALLAALVAFALLLWPAGRREIVYVVEPAQLPEIAERLGVTGQFPVIRTGGPAPPVEAPVAAAPPPADPLPPQADPLPPPADPFTSTIDEADLLPAMLADPWEGITREGARTGALGPTWSWPPVEGDSVGPIVDVSLRPSTPGPTAPVVETDVALVRPYTLRGIARLRRLRIVDSEPAPEPPVFDDPWTAPSSRGGPRHAAPEPPPPARSGVPPIPIVYTE